MNQKIFIANVVLLIVILFLGYLVATTHYEPPEAISLTSNLSPQEGSEGSEDSPPVNLSGETNYQGASPKKDISMLKDRYPQFGESLVFDTIVPKPTPTPTRTPRPKVPPDLKKITARWKLSSIFGNTATFQDTGTKKDWTMKIGETHDIIYRNQTCPIKLEKINEDQFEVIISYGDQQKTLSMF